MKVLFLYLKAFSFTGGIEKFNRCFLKALHELSIEGIIDAHAISAYDNKTDEKYFHRQRFKGWGGNRIFFSIHALIASFRYSTVILGHINLSLVGCLIRIFRPDTRIILIVHGIEVWKRLGGAKLKMLQTCDLVLSVSEFTKSKIIEYNSDIVAGRIKVFPNTIDPYFNFPADFEKPKSLFDRYQIKLEENVLLTITRLSSSEKYKGYDHVIEALSDQRLKDFKIKYLLCGKADDKEHLRIQKLINDKGLQNIVQLPGFVAEKELTDHYLLADVFVMPSKKEGFGIVFIEALACGLKVIAGSKDGSREALMHGELGKLIDPDSIEELIQALVESFEQNEVKRMPLQKKMKENFGFQVYKENLQRYLAEL